MTRVFISVSMLFAVAVTTVHADDAGSGDSPLTVPGEIIKIEGRLLPKMKAKPKNHSSKKAPPYSDRALLRDAWTKAWLLLDVSADGEVTRFKFLKRPGYDLETIAASEVFRLKFEPARDHADKPVRTLLLWSIEWPSAGWLEKLVGTRSRMPPLVGVPPHVAPAVRLRAVRRKWAVAYGFDPQDLQGLFEAGLVQ